MILLEILFQKLTETYLSATVLSEQWEPPCNRAEALRQGVLKRAFKGGL